MTNQNLAAGRGLTHHPLHPLHLAISPFRLANFPTTELRSPGQHQSISKTDNVPPPTPQYQIFFLVLPFLPAFINLDTKPPFATTTVLFVILHPQINTFKPRPLRNRYVSPVRCLASLAPLPTLCRHRHQPRPFSATSPLPFLSTSSCVATAIASNTIPVPGTFPISTASYARSLYSDCAYPTVSGEPPFAF